MPKFCRAFGCCRPYYAKNLCNLHYNRVKNGRPLNGKAKVDKKCNIDGCDRKHRAKGFCSLHYDRHLNGTDLYAPLSTQEKHGGSKNPLYKVWSEMKKRCLNPKNKRYPRYGGRGITVCDEWVNSFSSFLNDMGERPEGYTIERIDNDKGYSAENCIWASRETQARNKSNNRLNMDKAREIRTCHDAGESAKSISMRMCISLGVVYSVLNNNTWKEES